jgi:hypothetical protein
MRTITIRINVTDREQHLLVMAKADKPDGERIKRLLLRDAASTLRRMIDDGLRQPSSSAITARERTIINRANKKEGKPALSKSARWVPIDRRNYRQAIIALLTQNKGKIPTMAEFKAVADNYQMPLGMVQTDYAEQRRKLKTNSGSEPQVH